MSGLAAPVTLSKESVATYTTQELGLTGRGMQGPPPAGTLAPLSTTQQVLLYAFHLNRYFYTLSIFDTICNFILLHDCDS